MNNQTKKSQAVRRLTEIVTASIIVIVYTLYIALF
jgi:hypothetical protein